MKLTLNLAFILLMVTLVSCSKQKRAHTKLSGTFQITQYQYQTSEGFSYYPSVSGSIFFQMHDGTPNTYSIAISYSHIQINGDRIEAGTYSLNNDADEMILTPIINGVSQEGMKHRILILTKHDLKLEYSDLLGVRHFFIFEK